MQVKSIAECSKGEHSAKLVTFIKLPFIIKIFVLSIFEWSFYSGFTVNKTLPYLPWIFRWIVLYKYSQTSIIRSARDRMNPFE